MTDTMPTRTDAADPARSALDHHPVRTRPDPSAINGIVHVPTYNTPMKPRRETLLIAIAKARQWVEDLAHGRAANFAAIARQEGKAERHIRLLVPLAFVSPRIVAAILDGTAPAGLTPTALARALPWSWAEQERQVVGQLPRGSSTGVVELTERRRHREVPR